MTTVDYQVNASGNDGRWYSGSFSNTGTGLTLGNYNNNVFNIFVLWPGVTISAGATITSAYVSFYYSSKTGTPPACTLYFEDAANPSAISSDTDGAGRTLTTANISITAASSGTWWNSSDISSIIQELVNSYSYASGANMQLIILGAGTNNNYGVQCSYDYTGNASGPKLHIEYTPPTGVKGAKAIVI